MPFYLEPRSTPEDLMSLELARNDGAAAFLAQFHVTSNIYEAGLKAWAWDLGWREQEWLLRRAQELATGTGSVRQIRRAG